MVFAAISGMAAWVGWQVLSQQRADAARTYPTLACHFETWCEAYDCTVPRPADFRITPRGAFDRSYLWMPPWNTQMSSISGEGQITWLPSQTGLGSMDLTVKDTGEMTLAWRRTPGSDRVDATGSGTCVPGPEA
ncbi:MAG: hypothetical protein GC146_12835 [Limimaricola sp.]|nr:hypothetical protein [Limimaricola sp.]